mmetsp:Transcript_33843/g.79099  ORF Transcript_33843/g.79099 Transcript_33843/m.79099 type:complete len:588 (+) Transcript_33843:176-1939(+)|eukprot:CAMPEP_0178430106 /NCGR_PEP_ID=MMETSP0689_2-20121128/31146_1 /TAXON_ID=160604 /ORGANISM="Amphidinium massartii, Strain CS-259" /LENGTH=587 /DNA_ID=CAMNT_0020051947 /DNA_START=108 /DNA_END=1871 /DNA_ORIENTATION=-
MVVHYRRGGVHFVLKVFQLRGSVFPFAFMVALPNALLTSIIKIIVEEADWQDVLPLDDSAVWSGFTFLVGFLIVFRTSEAYGRFWSGCTHLHKMRAEWFDACASTIAFCKFSDSEQMKTKIMLFQHILVRMFSMLHAMALAEIEDSGNHDPESVTALGFPVLDLGSIDEETLSVLRESEGKVELVYQWVQQVIVEQIKTGVLSIPPPLLTRAFNELANGMVEFHEALKLSDIPFPFPYAQTCDCLLLMHWVAAPFVVAQWVSAPWWAFSFSFMQVFILWTLNGIAVEIENPFGLDPNDIDGCSMQVEMNAWLSQLVKPAQQRTPTLTAEAERSLAHPLKAQKTLQRMGSFQEMWTDADEQLPVSTIMSSRRHQAPQNLVRSTSGNSSASMTWSSRKPDKAKQEGASMGFKWMTAQLSERVFKKSRPSQINAAEQSTGNHSGSPTRTRSRSHDGDADGSCSPDEVNRRPSNNSRTSRRLSRSGSGHKEKQVFVVHPPEEQADVQVLRSSDLERPSIHPDSSFSDGALLATSERSSRSLRTAGKSSDPTAQDAPLPGVPDGRRSECSPPLTEPPMIGGLSLKVATDSES